MGALELVGCRVEVGVNGCEGVGAVEREWQGVVGLQNIQEKLSIHQWVGALLLPVNLSQIVPNIFPVQPYFYFYLRSDLTVLHR